MRLCDLSELDDAPETADDQPPVVFTPPPGQKEWRPASEWDRGEWTHWLLQHDGWDLPRVAQYFDIDRFRYGLGLKRHPSEPMTWFYLPGPAAIPFHALKTANVCYGGSVGGMKSHSTRWDAYKHCLAIPDFQSILMRRTHEELKRNHTTKAIGECSAINDFFGDVVMDLVPSDHELRFPKTNALITFGHCQNDGDEERYLGPEYDEFRPDEMATFLKKQIIGVAGRLRSVKHGSYGRILARLIGTTNPGGANTLWLKRWYIDKVVPREENPRYRPHDYAFIRAKLSDNPYLMDPDGSYSTYEDRLYAYSPQRRRQLLDGDWSAITGQFFPEWRESLHIASLTIPEGCKIECWLDWGYSPNPGVVHWVACFPNGRLYVFAEWVFNGEGRQLLVAGKVAQRIKRYTEDLCARVKGRLNKTVADPSMWASSGHLGESYAETFMRQGVYMIPADNDRFQGWGRFRHWFAPHPEGGAWLMYSPDCPYAIRTIPTLVHDANDPDDCDTNSEDHAADADRYGLMARPTPTFTRVIHTPVLPWSIREMLNAEVASSVRLPGQVM